MIIRKATMNDLMSIIDLNKKLFHHDHKFDDTLDLSWPDKNNKYYKNRIRGPNSIAYVAEINKKIVGYAIASIIKAETYRKIESKRIAELENIFIIKEYSKWAKSKGIKRLRIVASVKNEKAVRTYKKSGFKELNLVLEKTI